MAQLEVLFVALRRRVPGISSTLADLKVGATASERADGPRGGAEE